MLNSKFRTLARNENVPGQYLIVFDPNVNLDNVDILKDKGCIVDTVNRRISPKLLIGVLTKDGEDSWVEPDKQLDVDEVKSFKHIG